MLKLTPLTSAAAVAAIFSFGAVTSASAQATFTAFDPILDVPAMAAAAGVLGGAALVAAFTVGGGFRVAKKAYSWVFGKM